MTQVQPKVLLGHICASQLSASPSLLSLNLFRSFQAWVFVCVCVVHSTELALLLLFLVTPLNLQKHFIVVAPVTICWRGLVGIF